MNTESAQATANPADRSIHIPYAVDETANRNHFYENHWKRVALELLARHVPDLRGLTLLDYGCGRGETLGYAADLGMITKGLDVDEECVRIAKGKGEAEVLDLSRAAAQVGTDSYDVVTCFHVLEHVDNPKEVLTMLGKAARRYVLVAVPNLRQISNLRRPRRNPSASTKATSNPGITPHFRNLAENHCGLRIVSWGFDATILPVVSELTKRLFGNQAVIGLETGLFRKIFPYNGISVIALMERK